MTKRRRAGAPSGVHLPPPLPRRRAGHGARGGEAALVSALEFNPPPWTPDQKRHLFLTAPGLEPALAREVGAEAAPFAPGVVVLANSDVALEATDFVFARQLLPNASIVLAPSVAQLAKGAFDALFEEIKTLDAPWRLAAFLPDAPLEGAAPSAPSQEWTDSGAQGRRRGTDRPPTGREIAALARRCELVREEFLRVLDEKRRRVARLLGKADAMSPLVQLLLVDRDRLVASLAHPQKLPCGSVWPSEIPAGRFDAGDDWNAPSSAFRKLREALAWMGRAIAPGERVVDLGAAPGGWSHVALTAGASVTAVDRAALDPRLASHPLLRHEKRSAFGFEPESPPVDWLLCDMITDSGEATALLEAWAERRWFRRTVFHLKFQGKEQLTHVRKALDALRRHGYTRARAKHLFYDRNEVTVWAE